MAGLSLSLGLGLGSSRVGSFSPSALFAASEPGAWYDPSDLSTMFQDSAGTTPVTATGQTVGLLLDKSKGLVLGPELVAPINFTSGWTSSGSVVTFDSATTYTAAGTANVFRAYFTVGAWYKISFRATFTGSVALFNSNTAANQINTTTIVSGTDYTFYFLAAATQLNIRATSAGTVSVDNISVKELAGNHATQATAASRPIYGIEPFGGRRNLATFTEDFSNGAWSKSAATVSTNVAIAPGGTTTADRIVEDSTNAPHGFQNLGIYSGVATGTNTCNSIYCKADTRSRVAVGYTASGGVVSLNYIAVDLTNGTVLSTSGVGGTTESVGDGWYRIKLNTVPMGATTGRLALNVLRDTDTVPTAYLGDGASGVLVWGAQGEVSNAVTAYQRVTDQWNVTQAGVPSVAYIQCDGTDDSLVTPTITPGTDKAQVFAGVRKLSDAAIGMVVEGSTSIGSNNGSVAIYAPTSGGTATYQWLTRGTGLSAAPSPANYASPITNVLTGIGDIAADTALLRVNGTQAASSTADQGTGNYLAYPLYIGRRGGTTLPFNGRMYGLITRFGANLTTDQITQTEAWMNSKTGAY